MKNYEKNIYIIKRKNLYIDIYYFFINMNFIFNYLYLFYLNEIYLYHFSTKEYLKYFLLYLYLKKFLNDFDNCIFFLI